MFSRGVAERAWIPSLSTVAPTYSYMDSIAPDPPLVAHDGRFWLPIYTQPLHERRLFNYLTERAIPCYLPLLKHAGYKTVRRGDHVYRYLTETLRPMFKGYLFACLAQDDKDTVWRSKSAIRIFREDAVDQRQLLEELTLIRRCEIVALDQKVEILPTLVPGTRVMIASGSWEGIYGVIDKRQKPLVFIVNLEIMQQAISTKIDITQVKLVEAT